MASEQAGPIFVVGQPRSGSTVLTRLLNDAPGLFVINDFYVLQKIDGAHLWGPLAPLQARQIAEWVYRIIEIRCSQEIGKTLNQSIHLELSALAELKGFVGTKWPKGIYWHQVFEDVLSRAAELAGCDRWGFNTPQDHLHLTRLFAAWPDSNVIFLLRQPEAVLSSYKNASGFSHDPRRCNPLTIGHAWKAAAASYERWSARQLDRVMLVRYEDLVQRTNATIMQLAQFLSVAIPAVELEDYGRNSSYSEDRPRINLSDTEIWLCELVIGDALGRLGFVRSERSSLSMSGMFATLRTLLASAHLFFEEYLFEPDRRSRLTTLLFKHDL